MSDIRDSYCTPKWIADFLPPVDLDPCTNPRSWIKATLNCCQDLQGLIPPIIIPDFDRKWFFGRDGLQMDWDGLILFVNCPFSHPDPWSFKISDARAWCFLCNIDPSTQWWRNLQCLHPYGLFFRDRVEYDPPIGIPTSKNDRPSVLLMNSQFRELLFEYHKGDDVFAQYGKWWKRI